MRRHPYDDDQVNADIPQKTYQEAQLPEPGKIRGLQADLRITDEDVLAELAAGGYVQEGDPVTVVGHADALADLTVDGETVVDGLKLKFASLLSDEQADVKPRLIVADRYMRAVDWCVRNGVPRADVKIVTTCPQLRGIRLADYRIVQVSGSGSPREYDRVLSLLVEMLEAEQLRGGQ
jgi:hypothetical protein